jgi:hypothetical protein
VTGYNWWHEFNMAIFRDTEAARQAIRESDEYVRSSEVAGADTGTAYYQLSDAEFNEIYPSLPLKEILIQNRGMADQKERLEELAEKRKM